MDESSFPTKTHLPNKGIAVLALLIIVVGIYIYYSHYKAQHPPMPQLADRETVLEVRLQNLENSMVSHEKRLSALEETMQKLAARTASAASSTAIDNAPAQNESRLSALEKDMAALKSAHSLQDNTQVYQAIHLLSVYHHLSEKVLQGKSFATELSAFQDEAGDNPLLVKPLAVLAPYADNGVPTTAQLLASYDSALDDLDASDANPPAGDTAWQRFLYTLAHLVSVRKIDANQQGNSVDAILARATAELQNDEIEAAIAEIKSLPDAARAHFSSWLEDAQISAQAPVIIDNMEEQVMQQAFHAEAPAPAPKDTVQP